VHIKSVTKTLSAGANDFVHKVGNQDDLVLLGVNLAETDTPDGNPIPDSASIWLQDPTEKNTLSLCHGYMKNGQLAGYGCMPLQRGVEIVGKIWHARAGYHGKFCLFLATRADIGQYSPSWTQATPALAMYPYGKLRIILVSGEATVLTVDLRPDDGYIWEIIDCHCRHDDVAGRTLRFQFYDGTNTMTKFIGEARTAGNRHNIREGLATFGATIFDKLSITRDVYIQATSDALAAEKKLYIEALVLEHAE